jgi:HAD superfamily hydrolase (TIGR01490 family)
MAKKIAFFDIDGTVFRSSLLVELTHALCAQGVFPPAAMAEFRAEEEAWQNREGTYDEYITALIGAFLRHLRGVHYGDFADVGKAVVTENSKRVYRYTRDLLSELKAHDYTVVAISQSPKAILDEFCAGYGFDKVYGRIYELGPQDRFTGRVLDEELIADKAKIVERVVEKGGYDLSLSLAVGDTDGDIPLLGSVEQPICFNPNRRLYDYARAAGWPIVVERKDVVYTI